MKVKQRMTPSPITATTKMTYHEAMTLLKQHKIRRLPVVDDDGKLIGIVSQTDLLSEAPSKATTLSIYEIYTLLDKLKIKQIMTSPVMAVDEDCSLAGAARFMRDEHIGALPVVSEGKLAGIITETDIFKTFVEVLGGGEPGFRVELQTADEVGQLAKIAQVFADAGGNIVSMTTFKGEDTAKKIVSVKERGADEEQLKKALDKCEVTVLEFRPSGQDELITFK